MQLSTLQSGVRVPAPAKVARSGLVGATGVGRHFRRSPDWGRRLLRAWEKEQKGDGLPRVVRYGVCLYTTAAVLQFYAPMESTALERRLRLLESDLLHAFSRIAELERRLGSRR